LQVSMAIPEPLVANVYSRLDAASTPAVTGDNRKPVEKALLRHGHRKDLYVARPTADLPSYAAPGDVLTGKIELDKKVEDVTSMKLVYVVPPKPNEKAGENAAEDDDEDEEEELLTEAVFASKIKFLAALRTKNKATEHAALAAEMKAEDPSSIPLLLELLAAAKTVPEDETDGEKWSAAEIEKVRSAMMAENGGPVDAAVLAQYFGLNVDEEELKLDKDKKKLKKDMEEQRTALRAVLLAAADALGGRVNKADDTDAVAAFDASVGELKKWVGSGKDLAEDDDRAILAILTARHVRICRGRTAKAVEVLLAARKELGDGKHKVLTEELVTVYEKMDGLGHVVENERNDMFARFPVAKQGFKIL